MLQAFLPGVLLPEAYKHPPHPVNPDEVAEPAERVNPIQTNLLCYPCSDDGLKIGGRPPAALPAFAEKLRRGKRERRTISFRLRRGRLPNHAACFPSLFAFIRVIRG